MSPKSNGETPEDNARDNPGKAEQTLLARRLFQARTDAGLSRTEAAAQARIADQSIYRYEKGFNIPRPEILATLARVYGRPVPWFHDEITAEPAPTWHMGPDAVPKAQIASVPVILSIADGGVIDYDDSPRFWYPVPQDLLARNGVSTCASRLVEVGGNSMAPTVTAGSLVLVDTSAPGFWEGRMYLMTVATEGVVVRRVHRDGRQWLVCADNPCRRPRVYDERWQVHGHVRLVMTLFT